MEIDINTSTPEQLYQYAMDIIRGRWLGAEPTIAKDPYWAYLYALNALEGRFLEGESVIAKDSCWAYWYALNILKGRWPDAEPTIAQSAGFAYQYARDIIKGRFPEAEPAIAQSAYWASKYNEYFGVKSDNPLDQAMENCDSGAKRSSCDCPNWDSLPLVALEGVARTMTHGEESYGKNNWQKGIPERSFINHAFRHLQRFVLMGEGVELDDICDKCSDNKQLAELYHACANILMLAQTIQLNYNGENEGEAND